ncbi:MAG TPA: PAS domain-containing sensor histidine kinase [Longimicrobium sp.]
MSENTPSDLPGWTPGDEGFDPDSLDRQGSDGSTMLADLHRLLIESVRDYAIFALDKTGHILTWNPGAQRFKGYTADEIIGQHFSVFYPPEDIATRKPWWELEVAEEEGRFEDEGWRLRKDGTRFWANVVITALRGEGGELVGFAKVTRDLTERRAGELRAVEDARRLAAEETGRVMAEERATELAELNERLRVQAEELDQRKREAEEANRMKSEFLAAMSHELRTPLNAIGGYAELLAMGVHGPITPGQKSALERVQRNQQHLLGLINDILNFSRLEAGEVTYARDPVPLRESIAAAAQMVAVSAERKGVEMEVREGPGVAALADGPKVEQILLNLLSNAIKFTESGGRITLEHQAEGDRVRILVRDTGIGIPADQIDQVFEPFVQVGRSLTHPAEGTGLGLAISRELARAMGGDLTVRSEEGTGSVFTVTLPRATD